MFEDLTRQSSNFLASTITKNTVIRLQKIVTSPTNVEPITTPLSKCIVTKDSPLTTQAELSVEEKEFKSHLQNMVDEKSIHDHISSTKVDCTIPIQSNVSETIQSDDSISHLANEDSGIFNNLLYEGCVGLLNKISTLQLDDLKERSPEQHPHRIDENPNKILITDAILITRVC